MALPALTYVQRDFSGGQITEKAARRDDLKLQRSGLKQSRNTRLRATGAFSQRGGRRAFMLDGGRTETIRFSAELTFYFTFTDETLTIRDIDRAVLNTISDMPWTTATLKDIRFTAADRDVVITYPGSRPIVLRYGVSVGVPAGSGTPFGDLTENGGLAAAFDGNVDQGQGGSARKSSATSAYVGLDFTAGASVQVSRVHAWGANTRGYVGSINPTVTLTLRGKNGTPPANASDGTSLGTASFTDTENQTNDPRTINSSDTATAWDYIWLQVGHNGAANPIYVAEFVLELFVATAADQWTLQPFVFDETPSGAKRQPYARFAPRGITMTPSARTGSGITITMSGPVFDAGHESVSFRYHEREILITEVTSPTVATADVVETLPPTRRVTCADANGRDSFKLGQVVIGSTTGAEGLIVAFNSTTNLDVIVYKGDNFASGERIVSPTGNTTVSGTPSVITTAASPVWDEAVMSDFRGWPQNVEYDRSRLILCDFPQLPNGIAWSAVGAPYDLLVGAEANQAFFEFAPGRGRVLHVQGGADQFVITDLGVFYIPISESNPLAPGRVAFRSIAAVGASGVEPVQMHEGLVYVAANGKSLIGIIPTGQTSFPYRIGNLSEFHADVITGIRALAAMTGGSEDAEQYLWAAQDDGTALVGRFDSSNEWIGLIPVTGEGMIEWVSSLAGEVLFDVTYTGDDAVTIVENYDPDQYVDGAVTLNNPDAVLDGDPGAGPLWMYAGLDVDLMQGTTWLGSRAVDEDGELVEVAGDDFGDANIMAGLGFTVTVEPYLPNAGEGEERGQRQRRRRVKRASVTFQDSTTFTFMDREFSGSDPTSGTERAPGHEGRAFDPSILLVKTVPGPLTVVELNGAVTT